MSDGTSYLSSIGSGSIDPTYLLQSIGATTGSTSADAASSLDSTGSSTSTPAASVDVSGPGQIYAKLQQLQQEDPTKFKQVVSEIAKQLQSAATQSGDKNLSALASKFEDVANGGDLSEIKPPSPPQGGSGMAAAYSQTAQMSGQPPSGPPPSSANGTSGSSAGSNTMQSLFSNIGQEIDSALAGITSSQSS